MQFYLVDFWKLHLFQLTHMYGVKNQTRLYQSTSIILVCLKAVWNKAMFFGMLFSFVDFENAPLFDTLAWCKDLNIF